MEGVAFAEGVTYAVPSPLLGMKGRGNGGRYICTLIRIDMYIFMYIYLTIHIYEYSSQPNHIHIYIHTYICIYIYQR
jgi:hypothetical protein